MNDIFDLFSDDPQVPPAPVKKPTPPAPVKKPPVLEKPLVEAVPKPEAVDPKTRNHAAFLDCGHLNWRSESENEAAVVAGKCCANTVPISWTHLRGKYLRPLPAGVQRTLEKDSNGGFPGYCCDNDGWYIGGIGNNCRFYSPDDRRCIVHKSYRRRAHIDVVEPAPEPVTPEPVEEPIELVDLSDLVPVQDTKIMMPPLPKAGGSWKQRQMKRK